MKNESTTIRQVLRHFYLLSFILGITLIMPGFSFLYAATPPVTMNQRYTVPGSYTFSVPEGVTSLTIQTWGGGGRGGSRTSGNDGTGGGGGGAFAEQTFAVTPGESYIVVVGAGSTSNTSAGGDSYVTLTNAAGATVLAKGGNSAATNGTTGATGGSSAASIGSIKYSGGNGANRVSTTASGGGGSSAGSGANGNNASGTTGGIAPFEGGNGGNGRTSAGSGSAGSYPGGGGGGAVRSSTGSPGGGAGGHGQVNIIFSYTVDAGSDTTQCNNSLFYVSTNTPPSGYSAAWSVVSGTGYIYDNSKLTSSIIVPRGFSATVRLTVTNGSITATDDVVLTNSNACTPVCNDPLNDNGDLENSGSITTYNLTFQGTPAALVYQNTNPTGWSEAYGSNTPNTTSFTGAYHLNKTGASGNPHSGNKFVYMAGNGFCFSALKTGTNLPCGKTYRVSVWVAAYSNTSTQSNAPFFLEFFAGGTNLPTISVAHECVAPASTSWNNLNWQHYSFTYTVPGAGYEWSDFVFTTLHNVNGIVIDDMCIEEVTSGAAANAGNDVLACQNSTIMNANTPESGYSGNWSVISGNASISNASSPTTPVTIDSGNSARLRWTVSANPGTNTIVALDPKKEGGFENCCTAADNGWTTVNHSTNQWQIGSVSNPSSGNRAAYISNNGGTSYTYTLTTAQTSHFYRDIIIPPDATNLNLSFKWKAMGQSGFDRILVYTAPTSVTPVAGTPASSSTTLSGATLVSSTNLHSSYNYQTESISLPNGLAGTEVRIIFTWQNNNSTGVTPPASVDEISLTYDMPVCSEEDDVNIAYTSGASFTVNNDTICAGESSVLTASGCGGGSLNWSTGESTSSITVGPILTTQYSVSCTPAASANLLLNPGYESSTNLQYWENWANASITTTASHIYQGSKAVRVNTIGQSWGGVAQGIASSPGKRYIVKVYAKTTNSNVLPQLRHQFYNGATLIDDAFGPVITSAGYQQYQYEFVSPPNTTWLTIFAEIGGGGELYLDNWELYEYSSCTQVATSNVIVGEVNKVANFEMNNDLNGWSFYYQSGNNASASLDNTNQLSGPNSARINITTASGTNWHIQYLQNNKTLQAGKIYEVKFKAKSTANRIINAFVDLGQSPWTTYFNQDINLTTSSQTYSFTFTQTADTPLGRIGFNLGQSAQTVWLDSITLVEKCELWEICDNGIDDDLDGLVDCFDSDCSAPTSNVLELNFESNIPPALISGSDKTQGALYRFSNIAAGVDALVTIDSIHSVLVFEQIFHLGLSHRIRGVPQNDPFVEYSIQLVQAGTNTPISPVDLVLSSFDIDGINDVTKPYSDAATYYNINGFFALSNNSKINATNLSNEDYRFEITPVGNAYPEDPTGIDPDYGVGVVYTDVNSFKVRLGVRGSYTGNDARTIKVSGLKSQIQYFSDINCFHVEVCDNGLDDDDDGFSDCDDSDCSCCHLFTPVIEGNDIFCAGSLDPIELSVSEGVSYLWSTGETTQSITVIPILSTTYMVTVTNAAGCAKIVQKAIVVENCGGSICFFGNNEVYADVKWTIIYDTIPSQNKVRIRTTFSKNFVDNTFGTNAIGWSSGHTFSQLVGSDHLIISLYDTANVKKIEMKMDYITASTAAPSGYKCLGVTGGEGSMIVGSASDVIGVETSLDRNMNTYGYVLTTNSPATNANYDPDPAYPLWIYDVWYEAEVKLSAFGAAGFGTVDITGIHASPSKTGNNTEYVDPGDCCLLEPVIEGDTLVCPGTPTTLSVDLLVNSSVQLDASDDTYISEEKSGKNFGNCGDIKIGLKNSLKERGLIKFNTNDIPPDATIISAELITVKTGGSTVSTTASIHALNDTWTENTGDCKGKDLTPNWIKRNTTTDWTSPGGDYGSSISSQSISANGIYTWNITSTVQNWVANPGSNFGLLLKTSETANNEYVFGSSENSTTANRPMLNITYLAPPGNVSYLWSNGATTDSIVVTLDTTTLYTVTVTAPGTCNQAGAQKLIRVLNVNDASPVTICPGSSTPLGVQITGDPGPYTYQWSPSTGLSATNIANPIASPLVNTTYTVTVTGTNGCTAVTTRTVNLNATVNAAISGPDGICPGSSITLSGSGGQSYFWNTGASSQNIVVNTSGTYYVTVTNSSNCTAVANKTIAANASISLSLQNLGGPCINQNSRLVANPSGGSGIYTFNWTGPGGFVSTLDTIDILVNGNYYVTVTDNTGCHVSGSTFVYTAYQPFIVTLNADICEGETVTLDVNSSTAVSYLWSANAGSATTKLVTVTPSYPSSTYTVTVTNNLGCTSVPEMVINVYERPAVLINGPQEICVGETTTLNPASGGSWTSTNPSVASVTNGGTVTGLSAGTATFIFTENVHNCPSNPTAPIVVKAKPIIQLSGPPVICVGDTSQMTPNNGGSWTSTNPSVATITNSGLITGISAGTTNFIFINATTSCSSNASATLTVDSLPVVTMNGVDQVCLGSNIFFTVNHSGGTWTTSDTLIATVNNSGIVSTVDTGLVTIYYDYTSGVCSGQVSKSLYVAPVQSVQFGGPDEICVGQTTFLTPASGGTWYSSNPTVATISNEGNVTGLESGYASFTFVADSTGCVSEPSGTLTVLAKPSVILNGPSGVCVGGTTSFLPFSGGNWIALNPFVATISNNGTVTGVAAGQARFIFTHTETGCVSDTTSIIQVGTNPSAIIDYMGSVCLRDNSQISVSPSGGNPPYTYQWVGPLGFSGNTQIVNIQNNGTYYVTVSDNFGCKTNLSGFVYQRFDPIIVNLNTSVCEGQSTNLSINASNPVTYLWSANAGSATTSAVTVTPTLPSSTYNVTVTNNLGCTGVATAVINVNAKPVATITGSSNICVGQTTNMSPTTGGVWTSLNPSFASITNSGVVTGTNAGTARFIFTQSSSGCASDTSSAITINARTPISLGGLSSICVGNQTQLLPASGGTWTAINPTIATVAPNGIVTGLSQGIAQFSFVNSQGCASSGTLSVTVNSKPAIVLNGPSQVCIGSTTQFLPSSGGSWVSSYPSVATISSSGLVNGVNPGTAKFIFTNTSTGCVSDSSVLITVLSRPVVSITGNTTICIGATTTLSPSTGGTWTSNNPSVASVTNAGLVTGISAGNTAFIFTQTSTGCTSLPTASITVNARPSVTITGPNGICLGATTTLSPTTGGAWSSSNTNVATVSNAGVVTGIASGLANFTFTSATTGCISLPTGNVTVYSKPTVSTSSTALCIGGTVNLQPSTGGTWASLQPDIAIVNNSGIVTGLTSGTAQFVFTDGSTGCVSNPTSSHTVSPKPTVAITGTSEFCQGSTTTLSPTTGGSWVSLSPSIASVTNAGIVTGLSNGTARFVFTTNLGCSSDPSEQVIINGKPLASINGPASICVGNTTNLTPATGGTWVSSKTNIATVTPEGIVTGVAAGTVRFVFTQSSTGCSSDSSAYVTVNANPGVGRLGPATICIGQTSQLTPTAGGTWISLTTTVASINNAGLVTGIGAGTASFKFVQSSTGCETVYNNPVTVLARPETNLTGPSSICIGATSQFTPSSGGTWSSLNPAVATIDQTGIVTGIAQGITSFTFTSQSTGCISVPSAPVTVLAKPSIALNGPSVLCIGSNTQFLPNGGGSWVSSNPAIATISNAGVVTAVSQGNTNFIYTDNNTGCTSNPSVVVTVQPPADITISGDKNICLGYNTTLSAATTGVWYSTRTDIAKTTSNGLVTGTAPGRVTFYFVDAFTGCATYLPNDILNVNNCSDPDFNITMINVPLSGNIQTNDEVPMGTSYQNTVFLVSKPLGSTATITVNPNGTYTFTANMAGSYVYDIMVCLPSYGPNCPVSRLNIQVVNPNTESHNVVPNLDIMYTRENQAVTILSNANDQCISGLSCSVDPTKMSIVYQPKRGTATLLSNGNIVYNPNANTAGMDTIRYQICASNNATNCRTVSQIITVLASNADTTVAAADDFFFTPKGQNITSAQVLVNDRGTEGGLLTATPQGNYLAPVVLTAGTYYLTSGGELNFTPDDNFTGTVDIPYTVCNNFGDCVQATAHILVLENLKLRIRAYLEGALMENGNQKSSDNRPLMRDNLRMSPFTGSNYLPSVDPYSNPMTYFDLSGIYTHTGDGGLPVYTTISNPSVVFAVTGQNAIVDWVFVELRSKTNNTNILGTRSALIQRDGDIVDLDGTSAVEFPGIRLDSVYVVLRHRNHFGVMSQLVYTGNLIDFTLPSTPVFDFGTTKNDGYNYAGLAQKPDVVLGYMSMWAGDFDSNGRIKFVNPDDDQNIMFFEVLAYPTNADFVANYNFSYGYVQGDIDMNSKVKYDNPNDDKNILFYQVLFHPLNVNFISNFNFISAQVPTGN